MRILWSSTTPQVSTGYGVQTREIVNRLREAGHFIRIATKHFYPTWVTLPDGLEIFEGNDFNLLGQMVKEERFDIILTYWDIWMLEGKRQPERERWAAYIPIDTEWISPALASVSKNVRWPIAMSRHGERELIAAGLDPLYAPSGVDTTTFRPNDEGGDSVKSSYGWTDDNFVVGSVGLNYADDRKGFIPLLRAFKHFHESHPEARLLLHTRANERMHGDLIPYFAIAANLGISHLIGWPHQLSYALGRIDDGWLNDVYNAMDAFILPTRGEGFGLPIIEAQAAGIPAFVTSTTTGPELCDPDKLIQASERDLRWNASKTWRYEVSFEPVLDAIERAYAIWQSAEKSKEASNMARGRALRYDWASIWPIFWEPIFDRLNSEKKPF